MRRREAPPRGVPRFLDFALVAPGDQVGLPLRQQEPDLYVELLGLRGCEVPGHRAVCVVLVLAGARVEHVLPQARLWCRPVVRP